MRVRDTAVTRESSTEKVVKDRHRVLLMANHPDTGGSTFIASKINAAKDLLIGKGGGPKDP